MKLFIKLLLASLLTLSMTGCTQPVERDAQNQSIKDISKVPAYSGAP